MLLPPSRSNLKWPVFLVPFGLLMVSMAYSLYDSDGFIRIVKALNDWILQYFGWLFSGSTFLFLLLCSWVYFSPLARVRIGGAGARPLLSRWRWFSITLCTTIAIGILFWATAEPLYHLHLPPPGTGLEANSRRAAVFAMSTMFLHWTFTPYSIYTLTALMFALVYYNLRQPFSLGSLFFPLLKRPVPEKMGWTIDAICLYSLVAGMAASLGAGILTIAGGLRKFAGLPNLTWVLLLITGAIVVTFVISSVSGLTRGIRILSNINIRAFIALAVFALIFGPTLFIFSFGLEGLADYVLHLLPRSLGWGVDRTWAENWTIFYWANWLAWAPVTAVFLGRLSIGYTVRDFIHYNLLFPSLFSIVWMMIFSGNALYLDLFSQTTDLYPVLQAEGPEGVVYAVLAGLPGARLTGIAFLVIAFVSYVTAADSNTTAMSGLCSTGISPESPEPPMWIKIVWGATVGVIAFVMVSTAGIDGVKMTSTLGGFPALFLILAVSIGLIRLLRNPQDLTETGNQSLKADK